jgi:hypothetical protein
MKRVQSTRSHWVRGFPYQFRQSPTFLRRVIQRANRAFSFGRHEADKRFQDQANYNTMAPRVNGESVHHHCDIDW